MFGCDMWFGTSGVLHDTNLSQTMLNSPFGDIEIEMLSKFLKRESSELQSSSGNVTVGTNGCDAFVLTSGTAIFDGDAGGRDVR